MNGFLERLTPEAIERLRTVMRDEMLRMGFPKAFVFSDRGTRQIDMNIDVLGQRTAEDMIKRGMKAGLIEKRVSR